MNDRPGLKELEKLLCSLTNLEPAEMGSIVEALELPRFKDNAPRFRQTLIDFMFAEAARRDAEQRAIEAGAVACIEFPDPALPTWTARDVAIGLASALDLVATAATERARDFLDSIARLFALECGARLLMRETARSN